MLQFKLVSLFYNYFKIREICKINIFKMSRKLDTVYSLKLSNKGYNKLSQPTSVKSK